ncbi:MAG: hypothetical protein ACRDT6_22235 [Micromonosporaceae bacterium]
MGSATPLTAGVGYGSTASAPRGKQQRHQDHCPLKIEEPVLKAFQDAGLPVAGAKNTSKECGKIGCASKIDAADVTILALGDEYDADEYASKEAAAAPSPPTRTSC